MDMSILIDDYTVVNYVAKYCAKDETPTNALKALINTKCVMAREENAEDCKRILRRTFNNLAGTKDKCVQQTAHLINSSSIVECSHTITQMNLFPAHAKVDRTGHADAHLDELVVKKTSPVDLYGARMSPNLWKATETCNHYQKASEKFQLETMPLIEFFKHFRVLKGQIVLKLTGKKKEILKFSPQVKCNINSPDYWRYCLVSLIKYKPWFTFKEFVFDGAEGALHYKLLETPPEVQRAIILAFDSYFRNRELSTFQSDDPLHRAVDDAIRELSAPSPPTQHSIQGECDLNGLMIAADHDQDEDMQVSEVYRRENIYQQDELEEVAIDAKWNQVAGDVQVRTLRPRRQLDGFDLSNSGYKQQHDTIVVFLKMMGLWKGTSGAYEPASRKGDFCSNAMLVPGPAGAGKSFLIDCLVTECEQRFKEKTGREGYVHILAPTGNPHAHSCTSLHLIFM